MVIKQKSKEETDRENEIAVLQKGVERAEGRGQFDTSYHTQLARLTRTAPRSGVSENPPKETKEVKE